MLDVTAAAGAGPASLTVLVNAAKPPGRPPEVYNWTDGTWRALPTTGKPAYVSLNAPLSAAEANNGLIRIRTLSDSPDGTSNFAYLQPDLSRRTDAGP